jgi:hypothetical protein
MARTVRRNSGQIKATPSATQKIQPVAQNLIVT